MPDTNTPPQGGTGEAAPIAAEDATGALAEILGDLDTDTNEDKAADTARAKAGSKSDRNATPDGDDADALDDDATDDETQTDESKDGPARDADGRFVSPNAKVRLPDGTTTPVSELTKGYLRQSDYTRKAQELSEHRQAFEADRQRANETFQHLQTQYQQVTNWLEATRPPRPTVPYEQDPIGWGQYNQAKEQWEEAQRYWAGSYRKTTEARNAEQQAAIARHLGTESEALYRAVPALRDQAKREAFVSEAARAFADYGIKKDEIAGLTDHRMVLVLRDALKWRRAQTKAPAVKTDLDQKPQLIRGGRRDTPASKDHNSMRLRTERLAETGRVQDALPVLARLLK